MKHAHKTTIPVLRPYRAESGHALGESEVLQHLETDVFDDEDHRRITGIGNGVAIGAFLWLIFLTLFLVIV